MRCKPGLKVSPKAEKQNWYFFVNGIIFSLDFFLYRHFEGEPGGFDSRNLYFHSHEIDENKRRVV
jgi:hypothetical protein